MSRSEEFAAGHGQGRYFHGSNAELEPGQELSPGASRWHARDEGHVYLTSAMHVAGVFGKHTYEVEPSGHVEPDPELEDDPSWEAHRAASARVVRRVPQSEIRRTAIARSSQTGTCVGCGGDWSSGHDCGNQVFQT